MPIDPSIPLSIRPPAAMPSVLDTYQQITQLQALKQAGEERRAQAQEAQAKRQREAQIEQAMQAAITIDPVTQQPTIDYAKLLPHVPPTALFEVKKHIDATSEQMARLQTANLTVEEKKAAYLGGVARGVRAAGDDPDAFRLAVVGAKKVGALAQDQADRLLDVADRDPAAIRRWSEMAIAQAGGEAETGFTLGPGQVRYGPGGEQIAAGPPRESTTAADSFTLSPGSVRFGPGGEQIAAVPAAPREPRDERIVSVMGPDGKPIYVRESQALGRTPGSAAGGAEGGLKLTPAQQEDVSTMLTVQELGNEARALGDKINWRGVGPVSGRIDPLTAKYFGAGGADPERLRNLIGNIQGTIAKLRGGSAFSAQEQIMLERYTPTVTDSPLQIKTKIQSLSDFITTKRENTLRVAAGDYAPRGAAAPAAAAPTTPRKIGRFQVEVR